MILNIYDIIIVILVILVTYVYNSKHLYINIRAHSVDNISSHEFHGVLDEICSIKSFEDKTK